MSTTVATPSISKVTLILAILQAALAGVAVIPGGAAASLAGEAFLSIIQNAMLVYQQEVGQPLDITKLPLETQVP